MLFLVNGVLYQRIGNQLVKAAKIKQAPGQMDLFSMDSFAAPAPTPKAPKAPKLPKAPAAPKVPKVKTPKVPAVPGVASGPKEGDRRKNRAGNEEVLRGGRWRRVEKPEPTTGAVGGLGVIQDDVITDKTISRSALSRIVSTEFGGDYRQVLGAISGVNPSDIEKFVNAGDGYVRIRVQGDNFDRLIPIQDEPNITDKIVDRVEPTPIAPADEPQPSPIATPQPFGSDPVEVPLDQFKGKGWTPSLSVKAFAGENPLWFSQQDMSEIRVAAKIVAFDKKPTVGAQKLFLAVQAAMADGYQLKYFKAGKYGGVRVLVRDGQALTRKGLESRYGSPITPEDYQTESDIDLRQARVGDRKTINGVTYELSGEPPRWHRVDGMEASGVEPEEAIDLSHLSALELRLSHERERLRASKTDRERLSRQSTVNSIEREIRDEREFLGLPNADETVYPGSDLELLAELGLETPTAELATAPDEVIQQIAETEGLAIPGDTPEETREKVLEFSGPPEPDEPEPIAEPSTLRPKVKPKPEVAMETGDRTAAGSQLPELELDEPEFPPADNLPDPLLGQDVDYNYLSGNKTRLDINRQVKELLERKQDNFTEEELQLLAQYSGKGGIKDDQASLNEYYTRQDVAEFTADLLATHGFKGGVILEPSCGNGVFLQQFADRGGVLPVGVEIDGTSSAAARAINGHAHVENASLERFLLDNPDFTCEAITGNVPFGIREVSPYGADLEAAQYKRDEYKNCESLFLLEGMARLAPGGVMSIVVPHGVTSGKQHTELREQLTRMGRVIGAYRLPEDAFAHSGTKTITDILVVQKHPDEVLNAIDRGDVSAIDAVSHPSFVAGNYFEEHPEHILGEYVETGYARNPWTIKGNTTEGLERAKNLPLTPAITYEGIDLSEPEQGPKLGDRRWINGLEYELAGDPPRWHRVQSAMPQPIDADPSTYGVGTLEEAHSMLDDPGLRVKIQPKHLEAYIRLAQNRLSEAEYGSLQSAYKAIASAKSDQESQKYAHAVLLSSHLKRIQERGGDTRDFEQALAMLQAYRQSWGNPATDKRITAIALEHPSLLVLQGAFDESGRISDYFSDPASILNAEGRQFDTVGSATAEAYRANATVPVTLDEIREFYDSELTDAELFAHVLADPTIGYSGGLFMPMDGLIRGNAYDLLASLQEQRAGEVDDSPAARKLDEQIGIVRSKMQIRELEDINIHFWNVGSWIPVEAVNEFLADAGVPLQVELNPEEGGDRFVATKMVENKDNKLNKGVFLALNGKGIAGNLVAEKGVSLKDGVKELEGDFKEWLAGTEYRYQIEDAYNRAFNGELPVNYSGDRLEIAGFDQHDGDPEKGIRPKRLHDYQNSTIRQMAEQGRGIISLGVGLGKTAGGIGLAMHLKEMERVKKPGFVVPKSVLANWVKEFKFWTPDANIMILGMSQVYWKDGSEAYELPGFQIAMDGETPQTFKGGSPMLKPVGALKSMRLATKGSGRNQEYLRDSEGNYILFSEDDEDLPMPKLDAKGRIIAKKKKKDGEEEEVDDSVRSLLYISEADLMAQSVPVFAGGKGVPLRDASGNIITYADNDPQRLNPIAISDAQLKARGVLAMTTDDRATKERKMQQTAQNAYDVVLMSEPVFQRIPLSTERYLEYMDQAVGDHINPNNSKTKDKIAGLRKKLADEGGPGEGDYRTNAAGNLEVLRDGRWHRVTDKDEEKAGYTQIKRQEQKKAELLARKGEQTKNITWEELGIDGLFADEAHHYKGLWAPFRSGSDIAFISTTTSNRSLDFNFKAQYTRESNNNQNVYLLTATPTTNNPLEIYNMLHHVCPDELTSRGINNIDQFLSHFGRIEKVTCKNSALEVTVKEGLVGFESLNDLRRIVNQYCRMESAETLAQKGNTTFRQPEKKVKNHDIEMTAKQKEVYDGLKARAKQLIEDMKAGVPREEGDDHVFSIISDMDKAALDISYFEETRSVHAGSANLETEADRRSPKIEKCITEIMNSRGVNSGKQIVFCDAITMHEDLKAALVAAGYPEDEIAICNASTMPKPFDRLRLSSAYNAGNITLVIGNTATMGEGMNFQVGTTDIHHLNLPWTPAAIEQRDGRGVRQGNEVDEVNTHYYLANGSFDACRQDTLHRKEGWLGEIWNGTTDRADNVNAGALDDDIGVLFDDNPLEAKRRAEQDKEAAWARERARLAKEGLQQFKALQNKKALWQKMSDADRASEKGRALRGDIDRAVKRLQANDAFEHKALLESDSPSFIHKDGTILGPGMHVQKKDGEVYRIQSVDLKNKRVRVTQVSGSRDRPDRFEPGETTEMSLASFASNDAMADQMRGKMRHRSNWELRQMQNRVYSPIEFNDEIHYQRILAGNASYDGLRSISPDWLDANRETVKEAIGRSYDSFVYRDAEGEIKSSWGRDIPKDAAIILPSDTDAVEEIIKGYAISKIGQPSWGGNASLNKAIQAITGKRPSEPDIADKIQAYQQQYEALMEQGPKEGDRKTENGVEYELRNSRWHRLDEPAPTPEPTFDANQALRNLQTNRSATLPNQPTPTAEPTPVDNALSKMRDKLGSSPALLNILNSSRVDEAGKRLTFDKMFNDNILSVRMLSDGGMEAYRSLQDPATKAAVMDRLYAEMKGSASGETEPAPESESPEPEKQPKTPIGGVTRSQERLSSVVRKINMELDEFPEGIDKRRAKTAFQVISEGINPERSASLEQLKQYENALRTIEKMGDPGAMLSAIVDLTENGNPPPKGNVSPDREPHPDPIGWMQDAILQLEMASSDGVSLRNDEGWSGSTIEFGSSLAGKLQAGEQLTPNQLRSALSMLTKHRRQVGEAPTMEELEEAIKQRGIAEVEARKSKPPTERTKKEVAADIVDLIKQNAQEAGYTPNLSEWKGSINIWLNPPGQSKGGPGFITVHDDGTIENRSELSDEHPAVQMALAASNGMKGSKPIVLASNKQPSRQEFAEALASELNQVANQSGYKAAVWKSSDGKRVNIYLNPTSGGRSKEKNYLEITEKGITDKTAFRSDHLILEVANKMTSEIFGQHGSLIKAARYIIGGVTYFSEVRNGIPVFVIA